jgi:hypothetical protein
MTNLASGDTKPSQELGRRGFGRNPKGSAQEAGFSSYCCHPPYDDAGVAKAVVQGIRYDL